MKGGKVEVWRSESDSDEDDQYAPQPPSIPAPAGIYEVEATRKDPEVYERTPRPYAAIYDGEDEKEAGLAAKAARKDDMFYMSSLVIEVCPGLASFKHLTSEAYRRWTISSLTSLERIWRVFLLLFK